MSENKNPEPEKSNENVDADQEVIQNADQDAAQPEEMERECLTPPLTPSSAVSCGYFDDIFEQSEKKLNLENEEIEVEKTPDDCCKLFKTFLISDGRYEPYRIMGEGRYGVVVAAKDHLLKRNVAIKKIRNVFKQSNEYQKRILREILLLRHLKNHENVIQLYDLIPPANFENFNDIYIVTDLMDSDLYCLLRRRNKPIRDEHVQYFMYQIFKALEYIHEASVLHRDLKPSNILLNKNLDVRICDFGLSRGIDFNVKMSTHYVVTRYYRAPELLLMWEKTTTAIDIWSAGCIFSELLSLEGENGRRKVLFRGTGWIDQLQRIIEIVGTPKDEEMYGSASGLRYMRKMKKKVFYNQRDFQKLFPNVKNEKGVDLLEKLLTFDPFKRISAKKALKHPYFQKIRECEEKVESKVEKFDFRYHEESFEEKSIKDKLFKVIWDWNEGSKISRAKLSDEIVKIKLKKKSK